MYQQMKSETNFHENIFEWGKNKGTVAKCPDFPLSVKFIFFPKKHQVIEHSHIKITQRVKLLQARFVIADH